MKVAYVLVFEELWKPLIRRQVIDLLEEISKLERSLEISVIMAYPWYWHLSQRFQLRQKITAIKPAGIKIHLVPLPFPAPLPFFWPRYAKGRGFRPITIINRISLRFLHVLLFPYLVKLYFFDGIRLFHGRSYPSTSSLIFLKNFLPDLKVIFDPRSDFPEENLMRESASMNFKDFHYWKAKEYQLLKAADATVCITDYYKHHYRRVYRKLRSAVIPNNVDTERFRFDEQWRTLIREKERLTNKTVFCYLGTMYPGSWHRPAMYAEFIKMMRQIQREFLLLFLVPANCSAYLSEELKKAGIRECEYRIRNPQYEEVPQYLAAADFGLFFMPQRKIALSVKVVEYLATGLPVIANTNAISAGLFLRRHQAGFQIKLNAGWSRRQIRKFQMKISEMNFQNDRSAIVELAQQHFCNKRVATSYLELYRDLVSGSKLTKLQSTV